MRFILHGTCTVVAVLLCCGWPALPAEAATVELTVRDDAGRGVAHVGILLGDSRSRRAAETDSGGRAVFEGVEPGRYPVRLDSDARRVYVDPPLNPATPSPEITVPQGASSVQAAIEIVRAVRVVCRVATAGEAVPGAVVRFREADRGFEHTLPMRGMLEREMRLVPGRWLVQVEPVPGYLLHALELDGRSLDGYVALVDLPSEAPTEFVSWEFAAPARLWGRVGFRGEAFSVSIVARLVEPGPWIEAVRARGGSAYEIVSARVDPRTSLYEMVLPDGTWDVRPEGDGLRLAEPEAASRSLSPGADEQLDFTVAGEDAGPGTSFFVEVTDPDGVRLSGATVEVWPRGSAGPPDEPLVREKTRWGTRARVRGLAAGGYRVAAGHPDFLEAHVDIGDFEPAARGEAPPLVSVRLRAGATLHAVAVDEDGRPVPGVRLDLVRGGEAPATWLSDPELADAARFRQVDTDTTGHGWIRGIHPGRWNLRGEMGGDDASGRAVRFGDAGELQERWTLDIDDTAEHEVDVRVVRAPNISGILACTDGGALPGAADLAAVEVRTPVADLADGPTPENAAFLRNRVPLAGRSRDRFAAGPLDEGAYRLAVRPVGHDRWTWALGTEVAEEANLLDAAEGRTTDLQLLPVECAPAIRIRPQVATGAQLPDLRDGFSGGAELVVRGSVVTADGPYDVEGVRIEIRRDHAMVYDLPEGEATIELTLRHDLFLAAPEIAVRVEASLRRGRTHEPAVNVADIGGTVRVETHDAFAVRLSGAGQFVAVQNAEQGRTIFRGLVPGVYRAESCRDPACTSRSGDLGSVEVRPGQISRISGDR